MIAYHWTEIDVLIPPTFHDNGVSDPFWRLYALIYPHQTVVDIEWAARTHDFLYGPGRLPGSPLDVQNIQHGMVPYTRADADLVYRAKLLYRNHPKVARVHFRMLRACGQRAWDQSLKQMQDWGWLTWEDFIADHDKTYARSYGAIA